LLRPPSDRPHGGPSSWCWTRPASRDYCPECANASMEFLPSSPATHTIDILSCRTISSRRSRTTFRNVRTRSIRPRVITGFHEIPGHSSDTMRLPFILNPRALSSAANAAPIMQVISYRQLPSVAAGRDRPNQVPSPRPPGRPRRGPTAVEMVLTVPSSGAHRRIKREQGLRGRERSPSQAAPKRGFFDILPISRHRATSGSSNQWSERSASVIRGAASHRRTDNQYSGELPGLR
jgi:hypothetical protein